jgi:hypothetical protein
MIEIDTTPPPVREPSPANEAAATLIYVLAWILAAAAVPVVAMVWQAWL